MGRPKHDVAEIIERFGERYIDKHHPNTYQMGVLGALSICRTSALGGHKYQCNHCGREHISYNSCRNRHCPKCQGAKQAFWVEDRVNNAYDVKHYHIVFTFPEVLNSICQLDSRWFYNHLFACVWKTLQSFGYSHYGVEGGAVCVLHTWGQNLSLHPHIHCLVPALGYSLRGELKPIGKSGKFLYPVPKLSAKFKGMFLDGLKKHLAKTSRLEAHHDSLEQAWQKPWVVHCEPSFGKPERVVKYLGQYTHRVAISNERLIEVDDEFVLFNFKDYRNPQQGKTIRLRGEEFLRRFCLHILPKRFVKIRHYGIYSSRFRNTILKDKDKMVITSGETTIERLNRVLNIDVHQCPFCRKGQLISIEIVPRVRSPGFVRMTAQKIATY